MLKYNSKGAVYGVEGKNLPCVKHKGTIKINVLCERPVTVETAKSGNGFHRSNAQDDAGKTRWGK